MTVILFLELEAALPYAPDLSWEQKLVWTVALQDEARKRGWEPTGVWLAALCRPSAPGPQL